MRWITVGPPGRPDTSVVLHPPTAHPGLTDDERRTVLEMMATGSCSGVDLAATDLDATVAAVVDGGAEVVRRPPERPYGVRACAVRDPAGDLVRIQEQR